MNQSNTTINPQSSKPSSGDQKTFSVSRVIPPIVQSAHNGPRTTRLKKRTNFILLFLYAVGALPTILVFAGLIPEQAALQAFGWGLWLPGAGFVAVGGWTTLLFPLTLLMFWISLKVWTMSGMLVLPLMIWILSAVAAFLLAGTHIASYSAILIPFLTAALLTKRLLDEKNLVRAEVKRGEARAGYLQSAVASLDAVAASHLAHGTRELSVSELSASRYMFDLALQPIGEFKGFTIKDNIQLAALRYQLNYISYGLAGLQCKYTPNFHGYLNQAQRFAIESLTLPKVCGYWKLEMLWGRFQWNPDPIDTIDNVMLTGWSLIALSTYAANTGDLRYQEHGALQFKPFSTSDKSYGHSAHTFAQSLVSNWNQCPLYLFPCEPFWSFPICNALAFCGVVPYDRTNGTNIAANTHSSFISSLEEEFLLSDGGVRALMSTLTGWSSLSRTVPQFELASLLWMARTTNAIHAGHAKRWYALAREEFLQLNNGDLSLKDIEWSECFDTGNYKNNPGFMLANIALAAREHGDDAMAEAALRKADQLLVRVPDKSIYAFEDISTSANLNLAAARWARRDDWHDLIVEGPEKNTLRGPLLSHCEYPAVLVAKAVSDGTSLDLVLYNGGEPGFQLITIERLTPDAHYTASNATPGQFTVSADGCIELSVMLNGRTQVEITKTS